MGGEVGYQAYGMGNPNHPKSNHHCTHPVKTILFAIHYADNLAAPFTRILGMTVEEATAVCSKAYRSSRNKNSHVYVH
jgi:hypothetical protein